MFYDRQVKYFDDMVNGERRGNRGFVKIEVRDSICNVNLCVKGLGEKDSREVTVYLETMDRSARFCVLELRSGCGTKQLLNLSAENIGNTGIAYRELEVIKIVLSTEQELCAILEKRSGQVEHRENVEVVAELQAASEPVKEPDVQEKLAEEEVMEERIEEPIEKESVGKTPTEKKTMPLQDTKWKQLWEIYPRISPFQDDRKYLSVNPGDFVILPEKYFTMLNNSFLLHGFYNYHHLVLKRLEHQGQIKYYIGVPGNYYDREKQIAVMFGFEGFEGMQEPANAGDFGYYLMGIEL